MRSDPFNIIPTYLSVLDQSKKIPDKPAVIPNDGSDPINYKELSDQMNALSAGLSDRGVGRQSIVAIASEDPVSHLIAVLATMAIGAVPVALPVNDPIAIGKVLDSARPFLVVGFDSTPPIDGTIRFEELMAAGREATQVPDRFSPGPEDVAMIYFTSGTTSGQPKGVMQPHRELEITVQNIINIMKIDDSIYEFLATPTETGFWFGRCRTVLRAGGTLVLNRRALNPITVLDTLSKYPCNSITGDSPIFAALLTKFEKRTAALGDKMKWSKVASQSLAPELKSKLSELWPRARNVMNYGLMEAMRVSILPFRDHPDKLASVGQPCPGVEVKIIDGAGDVKTAGQVGQVAVAGANVACGYYGNEELWESRYRDGWYKTGDLGYVDEDGFLYVLGRKDESLNVGGKILSPQEIEKDVAPYIRHTTYHVCGMADPDGILGDIPVICVQGGWLEPVDWLELKPELQKNLLSAKVPRAAFVVDQFPKTPNGKLQRSTLRQRVEDGLYHQVGQ